MRLKSEIPKVDLNMYVGENFMQFFEREGTDEVWFNFMSVEDGEPTLIATTLENLLTILRQANKNLVRFNP